MNEQKRVKLTHGSARVDKNCSEDTLKALDEMSKLAYEMEYKPLNIDSVSKCVCSNQLPRKTGKNEHACMNCTKVIDSGC